MYADAHLDRHTLILHSFLYDQQIQLFEFEQGNRQSIDWLQLSAGTAP